jgi:hypothetical protein
MSEQHKNSTALTWLGTLVLLAELTFIILVVLPILFTLGFLEAFKEPVTSIYLEIIFLFIISGLLIAVFGWFYAKCEKCGKNLYFPLCGNNQQAKYISIVGNAFNTIFRGNVKCSCCNASFSVKS